MNRISVAVIVVAVATAGCRSGGGQLSDGSAAQCSHRGLNRCERGLRLASLICIETALSDQLDEQEAREQKQIEEDRHRIYHGESPKYHADDVAISNHESELYWKQQEPRGLARLWRKPSNRINDASEMSGTSETNPVKPLEPLTIQQICGEASADSQEVPSVPLIPWAYEPISLR